MSKGDFPSEHQKWKGTMERKFAPIPHYLKARSGMAFWVDKRESCNEELKNLG